MTRLLKWPTTCIYEEVIHVCKEFQLHFCHSKVFNPSYRHEEYANPKSRACNSQSNKDLNFCQHFFFNFHKDKVGWAKGCSQTTKSSHTTWDSQYCLCQLERLLTHSVARLLFFKTKRLLTHSEDGLCLFPLLTKAPHTLFQWYWNFKWTTLQIISLTNLFSLVFALSQMAFNFSWILSWSLISSLVNLLAKFVRNLTQTETKNYN